MTVNITYEQTINAVKMVRHLHDKTGAFFESQGLDPVVNSIAMKELQEFKRPESLFTAYSQGISLIEVAADHLLAFTKAINEPAQSIAPWTISRSVLEASALSSWLLNAQISARERVRRSLALRYEGLSQKAKFFQSIGQSTEIVNKRIEDIESMAEGLGFSKLRNRNGERIGIGQVMPNITEIIRDSLNEESNFRLYSAMAHSHHWAYSQLSFRKIDETTFQENKAVLMEKHLSLESAWWLCNKVAHYFSQPIRYRCELYGFDLELMNTIINDTLNGIKIHPKNAS